MGEMRCVPYTLPSGCHLGANCPFLHENDPLKSKTKAPTPEDIERYQKARKNGQHAGGQKQQPSGPSTSVPGKSTTVPTVKTIKAPVQREVSPKIHMLLRRFAQRGPSGGFEGFNANLGVFTKFGFESLSQSTTLCAKHSSICLLSPSKCTHFLPRGKFFFVRPVGPFPRNKVFRNFISSRTAFLSNWESKI